MHLKRVLIVDDQRDIRQLLREAIRALGMELDVVDVPSGEEAMLVITRQRFTLLVTDVRLAGMSGLELVQTLRKRNPGVKVILVTGLTDSEIRQQVAQAGVEAFFFKPVDILEFQNTVRRCLEEGASEQPLPPADTSATQPAILETGDPLERLRADIGAECAMLVDQAGNVLQRTGGVPAAMDGSGVVAAALAAHRSKAALAVQLGEEQPDDTLVSKGKAYQVHLLGVGEKRYLFALMHGDSDPARTASLMRERAQLIDLFLEEPSAAAPAPVHLPSEVDEAALGTADLSELDAVFQQGGGKKVGARELDDFWDGLAEQEALSGSPDEGAITYEQARRLGLAPEGGEGE